MEQLIDQAQSESTIPTSSDEGEIGFNEETNEAVTRYVVVDINQNLYGMSTDTTVELMSSQMTQVTRVPHSPSYISGVINHRGTIIPVIDMRSLLGFEPRSIEATKLEAQFKQFEEDHVNWIRALQDSINFDTEFSHPTDPAQCSFGKWFNSVLNNQSGVSDMVTGDPILKALIERLSIPHNNIHGIAEKALAFKAQGDTESALELISNAREHDLSLMSQLFEQVLSGISSKLESMLVITEVDSSKAAIAVDGVSFVIDCNNDSVEPLPETAENTEFLSGLVHQSDGSYILIADLAHIYKTACPAQ